MQMRVWMIACAAMLMLPEVAAADESKQPARSIYVMQLDGSSVHRVVYIESYPQLGSPRFSHDGQRLAFDARGSRPSRALSIDRYGKNLLDMGAGARPDWSPDDQQLVFEMQNDGKPGIWAQNADGKASSWLLGGSMPRWSPDGGLIAYTADKQPLTTFDVITSEHKPVVDLNDEIGAIEGYDWAPDGKRMAVVVQRRGRAERRLLLVSLEDRSLKVRLEGHLSGAPSFSPDGLQLAVAIRGSVDGERKLHLLPVDGDDPPQPIPGQTGDNVDPDFSPSGEQLAFASTRVEAP